MPNSCAKLLADKQLTVIFIESATAGYLAHRFSLTPYSGDVLMGSLLKLLYVGMLNASAKWTMPIRNWGQMMMQLSIYFPGRLDSVMRL